MKMDLNSTKIISNGRRKTFTIPVLTTGSCNQTFVGGGDRNINASSDNVNLSLTKSQISVVDTSHIHKTDGNMLMKKETVSKDDGKFKEIFQIEYYEEENTYSHKLLSRRDAHLELISQKDASNDHSTDLERLRMQEMILKGEIEELEAQLSAFRSYKIANIENDKRKTAELGKKVEKNTTKVKELREKIKATKEENRNITMMTKHLVDKINFPKILLQTFLNVSSEGTCTDEEFCRAFSGGKCCSPAENKESE